MARFADWDSTIGEVRYVVKEDHVTAESVLAVQESVRGCSNRYVRAGGSKSGR